MRKFSLFLLLVLLFSCALEAAEFFPYPVHKRTLKNGMDIIVIPTPEFKNVLSYNTLVMAGARNEIEKGKSGLAHLFEHILFRHQWKGEVNGYDRAIDRMGAFNNAWTSFDVTYYHPLTFTTNLEPSGDHPGLPQLEADRFKNLNFSEEIFKIEAGAVLGEYRRNASNPGLKIEEELLALAYPGHPYGHTTLGYLEDVEDMPNEYQAALDFYRTYYRPNNVLLLVTGDVEPGKIFELAERLYSDWQPGQIPTIREAGPVSERRLAHVSWTAEVPPRISFSFRMPPFRPSSKEAAVGQLLPELLAGETAPLYQKLRYEKKTANELSLFSGEYESFNSRILELSVILFKDQYEQKGDAYFADVLADIESAFESLKSFSRNAQATKVLQEYKSKFKYDLLAQLNSPSNIAEQFAWYYRFERDPGVLDRLVAAVESLSPPDIDSFAQKYFSKQNQIRVTMSFGEKK
ncbi:MAG: insulinase family protein [Acidobacteria bacterium]|nr:insulinase family protein [Acidobacteriota bacterium]